MGKWVANHRSAADPDGREYDPYNDGPATPLFHFGHGLTYTTFNMSHLRVAAVAGAAARVPSGEEVALRVEVEVANTGRRAGTEVVQLYCLDPVME